MATKTVWAALLVILLLVGLAGRTALAAGLDMAEPAPGADNPRKVLLVLNTDDPKKANNILYNAVNVQKAYGMDNVQVAVLAWAGGVRAFLKESSPIAERVESLQMYGVEFIACGATMETLHKTKADLLDGIEVTPFGIPELVERRLKGWIDIVP